MCLRTVTAFLVAPLVGSIEIALIQATIRPAGGGPTWIRAFMGWVLIASIDSYLISYTAGTIAFLILRALRKESPTAHAWLGALTGGMVGFVLGLTSLDGWIAVPVMTVTFAWFGASVATTFAAIRGRPKYVRQRAGIDGGTIVNL